MRRLIKPRSASTSTVVSIAIAASSAAPRDAKHRSGVDGQDRPGDAPGVFSGRQKYVGARQIAGRQRKLQRIAGPQPFLGIGVGEVRTAILAERREAAQVGYRTARRDAVHPNAG